MLHQAFSIFDSASQTYSPPFYTISKGLAIRMFSDTTADKNTQISRHPNDFTLFYIGAYDDQTALMEPLLTPEPLIKASETNREEN